MGGKKLKISEVAKLTGVTVRTLHYYDEIGLLRPSEITESGYRLYDEAALESLQQILFFRELDFPLNKIKEIMIHPNYDKEFTLIKQKELLMQKRKRIDGLINLIDKTIKGENNMSFKEFDMTEIEANKIKYADEVKNRWVKTDAYKESEAKTKNYNKDKWNEINEGIEGILKKFSDYRKLDPADKEVQDLVEMWKQYITDNFYNCTNEILSSLSLMYIEDERFKKNIDKNGEGTAEFMTNAIEIYCNLNK